MGACAFFLEVQQIKLGEGHGPTAITDRLCSYFSLYFKFNHVICSASAIMSGAMKSAY